MRSRHRHWQHRSKAALAFYGHCFRCFCPRVLYLVEREKRRNVCDELAACSYQTSLYFDPGGCARERSALLRPASSTYRRETESARY